MQVYEDPKQSQQQGNRGPWWNKVSRYFAFCVDGGLLNSQLTLKKLLEDSMGNYSPEISQEEKSAFDEEIMFLLNLRAVTFDANA